jgi:membrane protease YdiL (CAAX protease family)
VYHEVRKLVLELSITDHELRNMIEDNLFLKPPRSWLPQARQHNVPWSGAEMILVLIIVVWFLPGMVAMLLNVSGFYRCVYGPEMVAETSAKTITEAAKLARDRFKLWVPLFVFPLQVVALPLLLSRLSDTRPSQLGLTWDKAWQNLGRGLIGAMVLIPVVLSVNYLAVLVFKHWVGSAVEPHPLFILGKQLRGFEWAALFFAVLVAAPVMEELTMRGLLQPWLARRGWAAWVVAGLALFLALDSRLPGLNDASSQRDWPRFAFELQPVLFVLIISLGLVVMRWWSQPAREFGDASESAKMFASRPSPPPPPSPIRGEAWVGGVGGVELPNPDQLAIPEQLAQRIPPQHVGPAIYSTALLFASLHSFAWPSPIALFVLGLGLGWLAQRTQSLMGPILIHALFNAVGCLEFRGM